MIDIGADLQRAFDEGYERGKADEHRWWSEHCANCTDADRPSVDKDYLISLIQEAVYDGEACARLMDMVDRPQGKWIKDENGDYRCSECGGCEEQFIYGTENWYGRGESKFCPSCGARMKGANDES